MGAFICQISEVDWLITREIGVYGNREGSERNGKVVYFRNTKRGDQTIQSIIEDLIGMRKGDIIFFHVIREREESSIHGIYRVREEPFYNNLRIWKSNPYLVYPYRFCFEPHPEHVELCKYDANIPVSEFYRAVEQRDIRSILTLEREVRGAAHAVKKVLHEDAEQIIKLLYRSFHINRLPKPVTFRPMQMQVTPLRNYIQRIGEIEFAIKALVAHELGRKDPRFINYIPACRGSEYDFLIETFVGQTMRKPVDILCIANRDSKQVTTIEAKTDRAYIKDLIQSLKYQEIFKLRNIDKGSLTYKFSICLLAKRFHRELVEYTSIRNTFLPWEEIILLKYIPTRDGKDATFTPQMLPKRLLAPISKTYPKINVRNPLSLISSDADKFYTIFKKKALPKITTEVTGAHDENVIILERKYNNDGKKVSIGCILICQIYGKCHLKDFIEFMNHVHDEVNKSQGDFMSIEPIIVAEDYENLIGLFIEKYNQYETLAQRQPISAYVL